MDDHTRAQIPVTEPPRTAAVQVRGLVKSFGSGETTVTVLKGIDLDVYFGELLLLVGESGGGKTTLLSAIAGILDIDAGTSTYGCRWTQMPPNARTRFRGQRMGFIFQQFNLLPSLTAAENVAIPLLIHGPEERGPLSGTADARTCRAQRPHGISAPKPIRRPTTTRRRRPRPGQ
ncbi:MAG: ATP-binding cassette domain-containing protein [Nitrospira sp.]|nr:ATP-binding cassette domain-containing protein [Nitrospira sp.]